MKKFLSLALATLMLLSLAVGTSASGTVYSSEDFQKLLDIWQWGNSDKDDCYYYGGYYYPRYNTDKCPDCGRTAYVYFEGKVEYYFCPSCKNGGVFRELVNLNDCKCCSMCTGNYQCACHDSDCKYCSGNESWKPSCGHTSYWDCNWTCGWYADTNFYHNSKDCERDDLTYYYYNGRVVWSCECGANGSFKVSEDDAKWYESYYRYTVRVICSRGGDYSMDGSRTVYHGDTRTITFKPDNGYVLYSLTVDGVEYDPVSTISLKVTDDTVIRADFMRIKDIEPRDITYSVKGNGTVTVKKNSKVVDSDEFTAKFGDTVTFKFEPASDNYKIKSVKVNGVSKGKIKTLTLDTFAKDYDIDVTFEWDNPYVDVEDKYLASVEYVTEAGIMGYYNQNYLKNGFCGRETITVKNIVAALAEMADVNEKLDSVADRVNWAVKNGLIEKETGLDVECRVQDACALVNDYLELLEEKSDVEFEDFDDDATAKDNAIAIGLVKKETYEGNRKLNRYDLAAICNLLVNLDVE